MLDNTIFDLVGSPVVNLCEWTRIAQGNSRRVFTHPQFPDICIKTVLPKRQSQRWWPRLMRAFNLAPAMKKFGAYRIFHHELSAYLEAEARRSSRSQTLPIAKVLGLVQTDAGLGLVVEKITDEYGGPAPTLSQLATAGRLEPVHQRLLDDFFEQCRLLQIGFRDLSANNLVLSSSGQTARIVCVDGTGPLVRQQLLSKFGIFYELFLRRARHLIEAQIAYRSKHSSTKSRTHNERGDVQLPKLNDDGNRVSKTSSYGV